MTLTQIFLSIFLLFALSRVYLRFRGGALSVISFLFWSGIFTLAVVIILIPDLTSKIAEIVGIKRGADAVIYASIALLFYLVFRIHVFLEDIKHDITTIVREIAFKKTKEENVKKTPQD